MGLLDLFKKANPNIGMWSPKDWKIFKAAIDEGFAEVSGINRYELSDYWRHHFFLVDLSTLDTDTPNPKKLGRSFGILYFLLERNPKFAISEQEYFINAIKKLKRVPAWISMS